MATLAEIREMNPEEFVNLVLKSPKNEYKENLNHDESLEKQCSDCLSYEFRNEDFDAILEDSQKFD